MATFVEAPAGRLQYQFDNPTPIDPNVEPGLGVMDFDIFGYGYITLYLPVELRGISPLHLRIIIGKSGSDEGFADFDVLAVSADENTETYIGPNTWDDERWTFSLPGSIINGERVMTDYRDFDFSVVTTAETTHIILGLIRLNPDDGIEDEVYFMNARSLEQEAITISSGYLNRIHYTSGAASWEDESPFGILLNDLGLDFILGGEQEEYIPEASWEAWIPPMVNEMEQVVLRINWSASDNAGWADYLLMIASYNEDDFSGPETVTGMMWVRVDLSVLTGDFLHDMIDIDISHFFGGDVTHLLYNILRVPTWPEEDEVNMLTFMNGRTLTAEEIEEAADILPWEEAGI